MWILRGRLDTETLKGAIWWMRNAKPQDSLELSGWEKQHPAPNSLLEDSTLLLPEKTLKVPEKTMLPSSVSPYSLLSLAPNQ